MAAFRIGMDGRPLEGRLTGIGRYVLELCREMDRLLPNVQFFVYSRKCVVKPVISPRWIYRQETTWHGRQLPGVLWLRWRCGHLAQDDDLDAFWGTATLLPRLVPDTRLISTVHDFNHLLVPETMVSVNRWAHKLWFRKDVLRADRIAVNSRATGDRLRAFFRRDADEVVSPSVSKIFYRRARAEVDVVLKRYGITRPYLLAVGTKEPRKNLELLITSFLEMKQSASLEEFSLVLVGGDGWQNRSLKSTIRRSVEYGVVSLGYVDFEDLPALYSGARAFVFPSQYEGFGMPVLEARACGTRVIAADIPELREAGGEGAVYIFPDKSGVQRGIVEALDDTPPNAEQVVSTTWVDSAKGMSNLLVQAAAN